MVSVQMGRAVLQTTRPEPAHLSALECAQALHAIGLNVFPQPLGRKEGCVWKFMQHTRLRTADLSEVFAGRCNLAVMVGRTSGNLFVLDCETEAGFERALSALSARGIPLWAVATARGGHVYLRSADGPLKSIATGKLPGMEVRAQSGYVLAPPSIHPSGAFYEWIAQEGDAPPLVHAHAIDFLKDGDGLPIALETTRPKRAKDGPRLHRATLAYLANGRSLRHEAFRRACNNYRDVGYDRAAMERDLVPIANASGLPEPNDPRALERVMDWAMTHITPKTATWPRATLPDPGAMDWPGRTARTDRAVFAALVERAKLGTHTTGSFRGAQRELMALAAISDYHTLGNALERLTARGLVERAGTDHASKATLWRWGDAARASAVVETAKTHANHSTGSFNREDSSAVDYALFTPAEHRVLETLCKSTTPMKPGAIAQSTGLRLHQVKHVLGRKGALRKTQQVVRASGGWTTGIPDEIAMATLRQRAADKQAAIQQRGDDDRARDAARRLTRWRYRHDRANFWDYRSYELEF